MNMTLAVAVAMAQFLVGPVVHLMAQAPNVDVPSQSRVVMHRGVFEDDSPLRFTEADLAKAACSSLIGKSLQNWELDSICKFGAFISKNTSHGSLESTTGDNGEVLYVYRPSSAGEDRLEFSVENQHGRKAAVTYVITVQEGSFSQDRTAFEIADYKVGVEYLI